MENYVTIGALAIIIALGVAATVKHFKGEGGCCGGGSGYKPRKKKLAGIRYRKIFKVDGMRCAHCKARVEEVVNDVPGIVGRVDLKKGELLVSYAAEVADEIVKSRIERVGYTVSEIREVLRLPGEGRTK